MTTPGTPYFITPNQIVVADISGFRLMKRAMMDITGWISSVLPDPPVLDSSAMTGAEAFAAIDVAPRRLNDVFAQFPSALPYTQEPAFRWHGDRSERQRDLGQGIRRPPRPGRRRQRHRQRHPRLGRGDRLRRQHYCRHAA